MALRSARSPGRTTSSRWSAMMRAPCTVQGPIPEIAVSSAMSSSSGSPPSASGFSRPSDSRPARSRSVLIFRHDSPASRSLPGSSASSSAGEGDDRRTGPGCGPGSGGSPRQTTAGRRPGTAGRRTDPSAATGPSTPGVEVRPVVDEPGQHGVGVVKVGARLPQAGPRRAGTWSPRPGPGTADDPAEAKGRGYRRNNSRDGIIAVKNAKLEAARPGVDHQNSHNGHFQSRVSGVSSPCSRA